MIWPRTSKGKQFTDLPIVISPGGGGASAILDYEFAVERIKLGISELYILNYTRFADNERIYSFHVNGHFNQVRIRLGRWFERIPIVWKFHYYFRSR